MTERRPSPEAVAEWWLSDADRRHGELFAESSLPLGARLQAFPRYVQWEPLARFTCLYEAYKLALPVKGAIVDGGVFWGFSFMSFLRLRTILEPRRTDRFIYGFDSFEGFPAAAEEDRAHDGDLPRAGHLNAGRQALEELQAVLDADASRLKPESRWGDRLIAGDALETMPRFAEENPHLVVSLLLLDFDLYEPTRVALETFLPRMPRGAVVVFDELNSPEWPGETRAADEALGLSKLRLRRLEPYIGMSYAVLGE
jgi:Macrocin-O-methyltransferase (TylF)